MSDAAEKGREVNKTAVVAMAAEVIATIAGSCMASYGEWAYGGKDRRQVKRVFREPKESTTGGVSTLYVPMGYWVVDGEWEVHNHCS